jgi:hypothetical protein
MSQTLDVDSILGEAGCRRHGYPHHVTSHTALIHHNAHGFHPFIARHNPLLFNLFTAPWERKITEQCSKLIFGRFVLRAKDSRQLMRSRRRITLKVLRVA